MSQYIDLLYLGTLLNYFMKLKFLAFSILSMLLTSCSQDDSRDNSQNVSQTGIDNKIQSNTMKGDIDISLNPIYFIKETTTHPDVLYTRNFLELTHEGRRFHLIMQADSNLVLYFTNKYGVERPIWATNTNRPGQGSPYLIAQQDGNLVLYSNGEPLWSSNTAVFQVGNPHIKLQLYQRGSGYRIKFILGGGGNERKEITYIDVND